MEKYDIISVVGEGSYGLVMRCRHRESGQYVAIKKFLETEEDPTVRKMALREIRMLKKLRHENLVNMIEVFRRKKRFFLVFELAKHSVLEELEAKVGGLGYITSRSYIYQVLRALDFIHSHDVIHRDIKPENVLVSRLGVIKLCDFGFARPYSENETFTDYVATRWYRSPELLVGDRYGKEVDIWAVGCLYCEMMTGDPLFPGESDIDQLFQIVRILGKLSSRHQILIMRNAMFRGMKQEQNTNLTQMFPNWNRDSIDFLTQCLKMDGNARPDTSKLLNHELFVRDNFLENFLTDLRAKLAQEMQVNPLLKRIPSYGSNGRWNNNNNNNNNKKPSDTESNKAKKSSGDEKKDIKSNEKPTKVNLSVLSSLLLQPVSLRKPTQHLSEPNANNTNNKTIFSSGDSLSSDKVNINDESSNVNHLSSIQQPQQQRTNGATAATTTTTSHNNGDGNQSGQGNDTANKQISINNLTFKDGNKYLRILSAKLNKSNGIVAEKSQSIQPPPSPILFQSLQPESLLTSTSESGTLLQNKRLSPVTHITTNNQNVTSNMLHLNGQNLPQQYFNCRRHSNVLGVADQINFTKTNQLGKSTVINQSTNQMPFNTRQTGVMAKRDRDRTQNLIDATLKPLNSTSLNLILTHDTNNTTQNSIHQTKDSSPRILPPPQWLSSNLKLTSQGKISNTINATNERNSKRRITDWKSVGIANNIGSTHKHNDTSNDLVLPNCPGAISPKKSNSNTLKKKLSTLSSIYQDSSHTFMTPRNFSASSDHINET